MIYEIYIFKCLRALCPKKFRHEFESKNIRKLEQLDSPPSRKRREGESSKSSLNGDALHKDLHYHSS